MRSPFVVVAGPFVAVAGPFVVVAGPFVAVAGPFVAVAGPFVAVAGPFVAVAVDVRGRRRGRSWSFVEGGHEGTEECLGAPSVFPLKKPLRPRRVVPNRS